MTGPATPCVVDRSAATHPSTLARVASRALAAFLRADGRTADEQWREWARQLIGSPLTPDVLSELWRAVLEFDDALAEHVADPIAVDTPAVIVAGSGKEAFKTFNVSTAASILAAASGAYIVKGVSSSVSAVSGSADVLAALGLPVLDDPIDVSTALECHGIAFISYAAFCPAYARRYDGVFPFLSPLSFFMPVAVLAVQASSFVYGIAHTDVALAAGTIHAARPDLARGTVVTTELSRGEFMDETSMYGVNRTATLVNGSLHLSTTAELVAPESWRRAVAHRNSHAANAAALTRALSPNGCPQCADLVEANAALTIATADAHLGHVEALARVRATRLAGGAVRLLDRLRSRQGAGRCFVS